jgi:glycerophosphoryl diester phosphodiesterase
MGDVVLIHHGARRQHTYPQSSLSAIRDCLESGARVVEVDITPLADGGFALLHDSDLARATDGSGPTPAATRAQVRALHYLDGDTITCEPVGLLSQAVALAKEYAGLRELQLDLKPHAPLGEAVLKALISAIEPVIGLVRVTSIADWALRRLRSLAPDLALGFDPLLYLRPPVGEEHDASVPPFRIGAYGYADDHPLAARIWGRPCEYLRARADALLFQAPPRCAWYVEAELLGRALDDGFDWIEFLHSQGSIVDGWTVDADKPIELAAAQRLAAAGIDRITTNDAPALASALELAAPRHDETHHRRIAY